MRGSRGLASLGLCLAIGTLAVGQEPARGPRTAPIERSAASATDAGQRSASDSAASAAGNARGQRVAQDPAAWLSSIGAARPFAVSGRGTYLVAAERGGAGLALYEVASRRRLRTLEDSQRRYALLALSADARWIAGVRQDDDRQIDLWRADNGRRVRTIQTAKGAKRQIEFSSSGDELRVQVASGESLAYSIPSGVAIGESNGRGGGFARQAPQRPAMSAPAATAPMQSAPLQSTAPTQPTAPAPSVQVQPQVTAPQAMPEAFAPPAAAFAPPPDAPAAPSSGDLTTRSTTSAPATSAPIAAPQAAPRQGAGALPDDSTMDAFSLSAEPPATTGDEPGTAVPEETWPETADIGSDAATGIAAGTAGSGAATADVSSVTIHFATNRNRLADKDREWLVYFTSFFFSLPALVIYALVIVAVLVLPWFGKRSWAAAALAVGAVLLCAMGGLEAYVRSQLRDELSGERYGCRPVELSYGTCEVSVPKAENRQPGEVNRPVSVWIFEAPENPEKHFMLRGVEEHADKDAFYASLSHKLAEAQTDAALLFIHGYNVSFEDAIFRTAQLAVDLKFAGAPIAFCWPSYADPVKYTFDEQNAEVSIPALHEMLSDLTTRSGARRIHVIAHSMGNRVLAGALRSMDGPARARNREIIREVVLAAPDIDSRVFKSQVLPHLKENTLHCTLYASSRDRALLMSHYFHNYQRLGETHPKLIVADGMDTIDASLVDTSLLGHSYIGDVQSIVSDLHNLVVGGKRPPERGGLEPLSLGDLIYWAIRPHIETAADPSPRR